MKRMYDLLQALYNRKIGLFARYEGLEIVPYETLWDIIARRIGLDPFIRNVDVERDTVTDDIGDAMNK